MLRLSYSKQSPALGGYVFQVSMIHGFVVIRDKQAPGIVTGNNLWDMNVKSLE